MGNAIERHVAEALRNTKGGPIDELIAAVRGSGPIPTEFVEESTDKQLAAVIRRVIKKSPDGDGLAAFESIETEGPDGKTRREYRQLALLDKEEFRLVTDYYVSRTYYYGRKANSLTRRANKQHGTKRQQPFPQFGYLNDDNEEAA